MSKIDFLSHYFDRRKAEAAIAAVTVATLLPGCVDAERPIAGECTGYKTVDVEPDDTYSELILEHTHFADDYDASQINDILRATYLAYYQDEKGKLPSDYTIPIGQIDVRSPGLTAGETVTVPGYCELKP